jgi:hypothetical protein
VRSLELEDGLAGYDLAKTEDVHAIGFDVGNLLRVGKMHALIAGLAEVESEYGIPEVGDLLSELAEKIKKVEEP